MSFDNNLKKLQEIFNVISHPGSNKQSFAAALNGEMTSVIQTLREQLLSLVEERISLEDFKISNIQLLEKFSNHCPEEFDIDSIEENLNDQLNTMFGNVENKKDEDETEDLTDGWIRCASVDKLTYLIFNYFQSLKLFALGETSIESFLKYLDVFCLDYKEGYSRLLEKNCIFSL